MSQLDLKIGPKIKAFRRQLGLQANKLAEELSISPSYLNLIEGGKRKITANGRAFGHFLAAVFRHPWHV